MFSFVDVQSADHMHVFENKLSEQVKRTDKVIRATFGGRHGPGWDLLIRQKRE